MKLGIKCLIATVLITSSLSIAANAEVNNKSNLENNSIVIEKETKDKDTLVPIKEILKDVDKEYKGSILMVCHEPEFYDGLATQVWDLSQWTTKL